MAINDEPNWKFQIAVISGALDILNTQPDLKPLEADSKFHRQERKLAVEEAQEALGILKTQIAEIETIRYRSDKAA